MTNATISPINAPYADAMRLIERVAEVERTQRNEDVDGFLSLFDTDAVWITGGGRRLVGREAIAEFTGNVLPGSSADGSVRYDIQHIRLITPDVALTSVDQEYLTADGTPLSPRQLGRPSYVWVRADGDWRIISGQNTTFSDASR
ncbi:SgcJ/EcaC family oxidoreductase [Salinibacterium sp. ZJ454]|uniref:SgcJ/EcaC family oxidoreductase n=1 Tax=Salinibacterium sp. ZJ454 TaxID=2708339 RepID=UPI0014223697|nr:SgcJ/EcaC family oxidoreductase [Salinibacterium sp. ZJ454]